MFHLACHVNFAVWLCSRQRLGHFFMNLTQLYPLALGVRSNITPVLLPVWNTKVSLNWPDYPEGLFLFNVFFGLGSPLQLWLHLSAQGERRSGRAALYFCFNWPQREPEVWLLSSHQQLQHLPLHTQVPLRCSEVIPMPGCRLNDILFDPFDHSYLPWFEVFYKLLNNLADYLAKGQVRCHRLPVWALLLFFTGHISHQTCRILNRSRRWNCCWPLSISSLSHRQLDLSLCRW